MDVTTMIDLDPQVLPVLEVVTNTGRVMIEASHWGQKGREPPHREKAAKRQQRRLWHDSICLPLTCVLVGAVEQSTLQMHVCHAVCPGS